MALREQWEVAGRWLYRRRGWLPLLLLPVLLVQLALDSTARRDPVPAWAPLCLLVSFAGLGLRIAVAGYAPAGTSHRTTSRPRAQRLNTSGFYSILRHPLYLGNFLIWTGVAIWPGSIVFALLIAAVFCLYYERIMFAEEELLRRTFGAEFTGWAARTPAVVPRLTGWQRPSMPFSGRAALRREVSGLLALVTIFPALVYAGDALDGRVRFHAGWTGLFGAGLALFLAVVYLMYRTRVLSIDGR